MCRHGAGSGGTKIEEHNPFLKERQTDTQQSGGRDVWRERSKSTMMTQLLIWPLVQTRGFGTGEERSLMLWGWGTEGQAKLHRWLGAELSLEEKETVRQAWLAAKWVACQAE